MKLTSWPSAFTGAPVGSFVTIPSANGKGFSVTGNFIKNGRGRGVVSRASSGLIANNRIEYMTYVGIHLSPGFDSHEGAFIKDVVVSHPAVPK